MIRSVFLERLVLLISVSLISLTAAVKAFPQWFPDPPLFDFDVFLIVGQLHDEGRLLRAYDSEFMFPLVKERLGRDVALAWTYPPPFNFVTIALATLPDGYAMGIFQLMFFLLLAGTLKRLAADESLFVLICAFPAFAINVGAGQNGLMTASLVALACVLLLAGKRTAGVPLGLLIVKPHLAAGVALIPLLQRRTGTILVAGAVVITLLTISTAVFGAAIWPAFQAAVEEAGEWLRTGRLPLYRMASIYAVVFIASHSATAAAAAHATTAVLGVVTIVWAKMRAVSQRSMLAIAVVATTLMSPYFYDYDSMLLSVAAALLAPILTVHGSSVERWGFVVLCWMASGSGLMILGIADIQLLLEGVPADDQAIRSQSVTIAGLGSLGLLWISARCARKETAAQVTRALPAPI